MWERKKPLKLKDQDFTSFTCVWQTSGTQLWHLLDTGWHTAGNGCKMNDTCLSPCVDLQAHVYVCERQCVHVEGLSSPQFIGSIWRRTAGVMSALPGARICAAECDQECVCVCNKPPHNSWQPQGHCVPVCYWMSYLPNWSAAQVKPLLLSLLKVTYYAKSTFTRCSDINVC